MIEGRIALSGSGTETGSCLGSKSSPPCWERLVVVADLKPSSSSVCVYTALTLGSEHTSASSNSLYTRSITRPPPSFHHLNLDPRPLHPYPPTEARY